MGTDFPERSTTSLAHNCALPELKLKYVVRRYEKRTLAPQCRRAATLRVFAHTVLECGLGLGRVVIYYTQKKNHISFNAEKLVKTNRCKLRVILHTKAQNTLKSSKSRKSREKLTKYLGYTSI